MTNVLVNFWCFSFVLWYFIQTQMYHFRCRQTCTSNSSSACTAPEFSSLLFNNKPYHISVTSLLNSTHSNSELHFSGAVYVTTLVRKTHVMPSQIRVDTLQYGLRSHRATRNGSRNEMKTPRPDSKVWGFKVWKHCCCIKRGKCIVLNTAPQITGLTPVRFRLLLNCTTSHVGSTHFICLYS